VNENKETPIMVRRREEGKGRGERREGTYSI
jgi:hypothetical protein